MQYKQNKQGKTRNSNKHTYHFFDGGDVELQEARKHLDSVEAQVLRGKGCADSFAVGHADYRLVTLVTPIFARLVFGLRETCCCLAREC